MHPGRARAQFPLLATEPAGVLCSGIASTVLCLRAVKAARCPLPGCRDGETEARDAQSRILPSWGIQDRARLHPSIRKNTLICIPKNADSMKS